MHSPPSAERLLASSCHLVNAGGVDSEQRRNASKARVVCAEEEIGDSHEERPLFCARPLQALLSATQLEQHSPPLPLDLSASLHLGGRLLLALGDLLLQHRIVQPPL